MSAGKCDGCGRYFSYQRPGYSWLFVPDTPFTYEENTIYCPVCTEEHGRPTSYQRVDAEKVSGIAVEETP